MATAPAVAPSSLLTLPDELLASILDHFADAQAPTLLASARVCKRLGKIATERIYSSVSLNLGGRTTNAFTRTLDQNPGRHALVECLALYPEWDFDEDGQKDEEEVKQGHAAKCCSIIRSLPELRQLELHFFHGSVMGAILSDEGVQAALQNLQGLELEEPEYDHEDAIWWPSLARFPALATLQIFDTGIFDYISSTPNIRTPLTNITEVTLSINDLPDQAAQTIASVFPNLVSLAVGETAGEGCISAVIEKMPTSIKRLILYYVSETSSISEAAWTRLRDLQDLRLCEYACDVKQSLPQFSRSRIKTLSLGNDMDVPDQCLAALVAGPQRMPCLRRLTLRHAWVSSIAHLHGEIARLIPDTEPDRFERLKTQYKPKWPEGHTEAGFARAVEIARKAGIQVVGGALECIGWEQRFDEAVERQLVDHAVRTDDFSSLDQVLGREEGTAAIRRLRPNLASRLGASLL
ncbi:hypothetical protein JCM10908_002612 [Rhodotorula pacifica]|uniref:uncharacterized protein n=1 Tax=Rhodotorula pacifica TaxID=1495444 RepID=UPI00316B375D